MRSGLLITLLFLILINICNARNWPQFRGPNSQGISSDRSIPVKWTEKDCLWNIDLPGTGHSSPVIWEDKVFITCCDDQEAIVKLICLNAQTGEQLWTEEFQLQKYRMNSLNSYAATTPCLDSKKVYIILSSKDDTIVAALTHDGKPVWNHHFGETVSSHGPCVSPILYNDALYFTMEQKNTSTPPNYWYALYKSNGQTKWKIQRPETSHVSYSSPVVYHAKGGDQLIFASKAGGITAVNPENGSIAWEVTDVLPARSVACPVIYKNMIIANCGDGGTGKQLVAVIPPQKEGDKPKVAYINNERRSIPYVTIPIIVDDLMFTFHDKGVITCWDPINGDILWTEKPAGTYFGSPVNINGKIYCINIQGDVLVLNASKKFELLATNPLGEKSFATPAVADGKLYLRTLSKLICIKK